MLKSRFDVFTFRAQLQIVIWMECIRINCQTGTEVPAMDMTKRKKKDQSSMSVHLTNSVLALVDKLAIWTASADAVADDANIWKNFVNPILVE